MRGSIYSRIKSFFHRIAGRPAALVLALTGILLSVGAYAYSYRHAAHAPSALQVVRNHPSDTPAQLSKTNATGTPNAGQGSAVNPAATPPPAGATCTSPRYTLPANPSDPQDGLTLSGYYVDTDTWNFAKYPGSQQTMYICDYNNWYAMVNLSDRAGDGAVKTYPNVHKDYNSPRISSLSNVSSSFAHTAPGYGDWDFAYDIWINGVATDGSTELMIWTQSAGRQAHVPGIPVVATVTLSGITYDVHRNGSYIAYDMRSSRNSGNVNILEIMRNAMSHGWMPGTSTLGAIDYGVEVCNTGGVSTKFAVSNFSLVSN